MAARQPVVVAAVVSAGFTLRGDKRTIAAAAGRTRKLIGQCTLARLQLLAIIPAENDDFWAPVSSAWPSVGLSDISWPSDSGATWGGGIDFVTRNFLAS